MTLENTATAIDFDSLPQETLDQIVETGIIPDDLTNPVDPPVDEAPEADDAETDPPADEAAVDETVVEEEPAEEEKPAEEVDDPAARVENFKFTPDADAETRAKEEAEYLELVEIAEPVQQIIAHREARIAELEAQATATVEADPVQARHTEAFDGLVTFVQNEDGEYVPNTAPVRALLKEFYPKEQEQLMIDLLSETSEKYPGNTRFQEILRDVKGLGEAEMQTLDAFLENNGQMPFPKFVPTGVDEKFGEAYWTNPDRDEIDEKLRTATFTLSDIRATDEEKEAAQRDIDRINRNLSIVQKGVDADRNARQAEQQQSVTVREQVTQEGTKAYIQTTLGLLEQAQVDLAKSLTMFDEEAAGVTAASFGVLINSALSDVDEYAKAAQKQLADHGIKVDWAAAGAAINRLYASEQQIAALKKFGANPRAVENELKNKTRILLDIKGLEKNLTGQIVAKLTTGAGKALKSQIAKAPNAGGKVPAVRPRIAGDSVPVGSTPNFDKMSKKELDDIIFGRTPVPGSG